MNDSVKFIFKTLLKVPVIVVIVYVIFNVFSFAQAYFKVLGISYVIMQTAVENNYIPPDEYSQITQYLNSMETNMLNNFVLEVDTINVDTTVQRDTVGPFENTRVQYGSPVRVQISAHYNFLWPLDPASQTDTGVAVDGLNGTAGNLLSDQDLQDERDRIAANAQNNIHIEYVVPGLKYYPDLS